MNEPSGEFTQNPPIIEQLKTIGFKPAGESNLLQYDNFVVKAGSEHFPQFYSTFGGIYGPRTEGDIESVSFHSENGREYIEFVEKIETGKRHYSVDKRGGYSSRPESSQVRPSANSIEDQLKSAGFKEDEMSKGMFVKDWDGKEVLAFVENGVIKRIVESVKTDPNPALDLVKRFGFRITGMGKRKDYFDQDYPVIEGSNGTMDFTIDERGRVRVTKLLRELTEEELDLKQEEVSEMNGFKIGGVNNTDTIRNLQVINDIPIEQLEKVMRPGKSSAVGFLGRRESLIDVLVADNDYVLGRGLTHQDLARPLIYALKIGQLFGDSKSYEFPYKRRQYRVDLTHWMGPQESPFNDNTGTSIDFTVTNLDTGKFLSCSGLLPTMIDKYGFYEGKKTSYRLEPSNIIEVFDFFQDSAVKNN